MHIFSNLLFIFCTLLTLIFLKFYFDLCFIKRQINTELKTQNLNYKYIV